MWSRVRLRRKQLTSRPDHLWPELWDKMGKNAKLKEKQKWSHEKLYLEDARMRGIYFMTLRIRNSRRRSRMLARSWKHQWLLLCPAKLSRATRIVGVVHPIKLKQNLPVLWKLMNLRNCVWENHCQIIMKTIFQEKETFHDSITFLCLKL